MRRARLPLAILAVLLVGVGVAVAVQWDDSPPPPMTAVQVQGADVALAGHPTVAESADLSLARSRGLTDTEIRQAWDALAPSRG